MREKTRANLRTSLRDGPSTGDSTDSVGPKGLLMLPERQPGELERLPPGVDSGTDDSVLDTVEEVGGGSEIPLTDDGEGNGGANAGEVASKIRPIYGFLALKLGERIMEVLEKCGRLRDCDDGGCDIMAAIEEIIGSVEDIEALISALEGLMRDVDDDKITDPKHVRNYLAYCLHLRRKGRMEAKGVFGGGNGGSGGNGGADTVDGGAESSGGGVKTTSCSCGNGGSDSGGTCPCIGIERRKNLARLIGKVLRENGVHT
jgi:hypothetical protein